MHTTRKGQFDKIGDHQLSTKQEDEQRLSEFSARIEAIYNKAKGNVEERLNAIDTEVNQIFDGGSQQAKEEFENFVDSRMTQYKLQRYDVIGGSLLWAKDRLFWPS